MRRLVVTTLALSLITTSAMAEDPALWLARVAVAESSWSSPADRAAIWHVLARRADRLGWSIPAMVRQYSSPIRRGEWPRGLDASGRRPPGFPPRLSWEAHRPRWEAILEEARAFLRGEVPDPCPDAQHFGDRAGDFLRARAAGWSQVSCGNTANLFWKTRSRK